MLEKRGVLLLKQIGVLVVDDSPFFRKMLVDGLNSDPAINVVATASNPYEARDNIIKYNPNVMTLDLEMPRMNGVEFLQKLMPQYPLPVIVISSYIGARESVLKAGAVDFIQKPVNMDPSQLSHFIFQELIARVKLASTAKVGSFKRVTAVHAGGQASSNRIIAIGASTGGTEAIFEVIRGFRQDLPGIVIVQHMPPGFTTMYAERLNNNCKLAVKEAQSGDRVLPGQVLLAPGDQHMRVVSNSGGYQVECRAGEKVSGHCPSVDVLFESVAKAAGANALGIILTGMGADGAKGLLQMRQAGAETIGEAESSCVVYGMPKVAYDIGAVKYQVPLSAVSSKVYQVAKTWQ